ncbi:hypothetical protein WOLCODRAFT_84246 [Wolfiporia cocos MD-104 SS10]|uniref:Xylanolytic transcriptional activator regulatory domain-containing protein n=1 Tax=Wolfiporia cocos (strain MD-104) TaxID=742152 RepID=A0A2H3J5F1_WOLCO|nr:hypothetical protein WOLCODRAFT_84246 [Wolfiporia cocos MD-104 SS10]
MFSSRGSTAKSRLGTTFVPPIPYETFLPSATVPSTHVATSANPYPSPTPQANLSEPPQVTPALLERLPPPEARVRFLKALNETMMLHPCFNVRHFEQRVEAMLGWGEAGAAYTFSTATAAVPTASSMKALAQDLFFGQPGKQGKPGGKDARTSAHGVPQHGHPPGSSPKPTLSFFAAACAAFALGALVSKGPDSGAGPEGSRPPSSSSSGSSTGDADPSGPRCSPAALFALSDQALGLYERTALYDLDVVVAMILQILYQLHDGQMSVAQGVFPLMGKMINVARMMGLAIDPDEFPGTYSLFEAETRRRIWWDVFYYDLFVSDCMGHPPLIPDNSFTTRLPAEVDEEQFNPSSTTLPTPPSDQGIEKGTVYFALKCR